MINYVVLQGRLAKEPELRKTKAGENVCNIYVVSQRDVGNGKADVIKCEAWHDKAIFIANHLKKGSMVDIFGGIRCKKWIDENGKSCVEQFVHIDELKFTTE